MPEVLEYIDDEGKSPYGRWFGRLPATAAAKVAIAVTRMAQGNPGPTESVGEGVFERKVDFGPGYRIYFANDGPDLILLLGGGSKKKQQSDINEAKTRWADYRKRKKSETKRTKSE